MIDPNSMEGSSLPLRRLPIPPDLLPTGEPQRVRRMGFLARLKQRFLAWLFAPIPFPRSHWSRGSEVSERHRYNKVNHREAGPHDGGATESR